MNTTNNRVSNKGKICSANSTYCIHIKRRQGCRFDHFSAGSLLRVLNQNDSSISVPYLESKTSILECSQPCFECGRNRDTMNF